MMMQRPLPPSAASARSPHEHDDASGAGVGVDDEDEDEEVEEDEDEDEEEDDRPSRRFYLRYAGPMPDATLRRLLCARRLECFVVVEPGADARTTPGIIHARLRTHRRLRPSGLLMRIHTYNNTQRSGGGSGRIVLLRPERSRSGSNGIVVSGRARHVVAELRGCITTARRLRDPFYYRWSDADDAADVSSTAEEEDEDEDEEASDAHSHQHHNGSSSSRSSSTDEEEEDQRPLRAALARSEARRRAAEAGAAALCAELGGLAQDAAIAARQHAAVRLQLRRAREAHAELSRFVWGE